VEQVVVKAEREGPDFYTDYEFRIGKMNEETVINYTYSVGGKEFTGADVRLGYQGAPKDNARDFLRGMKLKAYYCPSNPSQSVLIPGYSSWQTWFTMVAGAVFFLIPGLILLGAMLLSLLPSKRGDGRQDDVDEPPPPGGRESTPSTPAMRRR
jgi:hypothetical protein